MELVESKKNTEKMFFFNCICSWNWFAIGSVNELCQVNWGGTSANEQEEEHCFQRKILPGVIFPVWSLFFANKYPRAANQKPLKHLTFIVLSPDADTMYLSSKSTTLTAARCPTSTLLRVMSVGEAMSHTAMERSLEHVTIMPLLKRRCSTASQWWISVFSISPAFTSHTLQVHISNQTQES